MEPIQPRNTAELQNYPSYRNQAADRLDHMDLPFKQMFGVNTSVCVTLICHHALASLSTTSFPQFIWSSLFIFISFPGPEAAVN